MSKNRGVYRGQDDAWTCPECGEWKEFGAPLCEGCDPDGLGEEQVDILAKAVRRAEMFAEGEDV